MVMTVASSWWTEDFDARLPAEQRRMRREGHLWQSLDGTLRRRLDLLEHLIRIETSEELENMGYTTPRTSWMPPGFDPDG